MIQINNKFNIGNEVFYINDGKLNTGKIQSITSITNANGTTVSYLFEGCYVGISAAMVFANIKDATDSFLSKVRNE